MSLSNPDAITTAICHPIVAERLPRVTRPTASCACGPRNCRISRKEVGPHTPDQRIAMMASRQHGVVSTTQLRTAGLTEAGIASTRERRAVASPPSGGLRGWPRGADSALAGAGGGAGLRVRSASKPSVCGAIVGTRALGVDDRGHCESVQRATGWIRRSPLARA